MNKHERMVTLADGREVSDHSEEWRYECELRWFLVNKPTRSAKHLYLYGVADRKELFDPHPDTGQPVLRDEADLRKGWPLNEHGRPSRPLMAVRSLDAADRLLEDARRLYEMTTTAA